MLCVKSTFVVFSFICVFICSGRSDEGPGPTSPPWISGEDKDKNLFYIFTSYILSQNKEKQTFFVSNSEKSDGLQRHLNQKRKQKHTIVFTA